MQVCTILNIFTHATLIVRDLRRVAITANVIYLIKFIIYVINTISVALATKQFLAV